jgi:hypothetical protein
MDEAVVFTAELHAVAHLVFAALGAVDDPVQVKATRGLPADQAPVTVPRDNCLPDVRLVDVLPDPAPIAVSPVPAAGVIGTADQSWRRSVGPLPLQLAVTGAELGGAEGVSLPVELATTGLTGQRLARA